MKLVGEAGQRRRSYETSIEGKCGREENFQISSTKSQTNSKHQIQNKTPQKGFCPCLGIVIWCLFEIWCLVLGNFILAGFRISLSYLAAKVRPGADPDHGATC
ncbi:MAG: hypothetical protein K9K88_18525 [Desulfobacterales bacterium]|nr:hypothetical protein [Desulfobacterales bacterium]